jgi:hypothetical protein
MSFGNNPYESPQSLPPGSSAYPPGNSPPAALVLAIASVVLGFMGFSGGCCCLFLPLPPIAILLGIISLTQKPDSTARTVAIIGIALGVLSIVVTIAMFALGIASAVFQESQSRGDL